MTRTGVLALTVFFAAASTIALAKQGVVKTRNGQTYEGDVVQTDKGVTVTTNGIQSRIGTADITSITYAEDFDKQLAERHAKLAKNDVKGRLALARQAFDNKRYSAARNLAEEALEIDPNSTDANQLRENAMAQIRLERLRQNGTATTERIVEHPTTAGAATNPAEITDHRYLKPNDINTIRQYELLQTETDVPIRFENNVKRRYAEKLSNRPVEQFASLTPMQQAMEILKYGAPEMRNDVKIMRDPQAMLIYRHTVQPYVLQNCATSQCHGGPNGGRLVLFNPADSDQATYTNFFILQAYTQKAPGNGSSIFGTGELHLIDRTNPSRSLLLQYSIPQNISDYDHPEVQNYHPPLRGRDDLRYRQLWSWIHDSLNPSLDVPNYGINFPTPGATTAPTHPASAPATQPATIPLTR